MTTKEQPPACTLCNENKMELVGEMNGLKIYMCPKCDRK